MGYRIVYAPQLPMRRKGHLRLWTAVFLLIFVAAVRLKWPMGTEHLRKVLKPREQTVQAFSHMVEEVEDGLGMGEAVTAFCRTVVAHGLEE